MAETIRIEVPRQINGSLLKAANYLNSQSQAAEKAQKKLLQAGEGISRIDAALEKTIKRLQEASGSSMDKKQKDVDRITQPMQQLMDQLKQFGDKFNEIPVTFDISRASVALDELLKKKEQLKENIELSVTGRVSGSAGTSASMAPNASQNTASLVEVYVNSNRNGSQSGNTQGAEQSQMAPIVEASEKASVVLSTIAYSGQLMGVDFTKHNLKTFGKDFGKLLGADSVNIAHGAGIVNGAVGYGAMAGGVISGVSFMKGVADSYRAENANDEAEKSVYSKAADDEVKGVAIGASIGAMIGLVTPFGPAVGAMIGGGIGGMVGMNSADNLKEDFDELKRSEEAVKQGAELLELKAKFASKEMKNALSNPDMNAEEFEALFQNAVTKRLEQSFGSIRLSLEEIQKLSQKIVFRDQADDAQRFSLAAKDANDALQSFQSGEMNTDKLIWKAGFEIQDEESQSELRRSVEDTIDKAITALEEQHYKAAVSLELLTGSSDSINGLDELYAEMVAEIKELKNKQQLVIDNALSDDGMISPDEKKQYDEISDHINDITRKPEEARQTAAFDAVGVKYKGSNLTYGSFSQMQEEMVREAQEFQEQYDDALKTSLSNLELVFSSTGMSKDEYEAKKAELADNYHKEMEALKESVQSFQIDAIVDTYGAKMENVLPEFDGDLAKQLTAKLNEMLKAGIDLTEKPPIQISDMFQLGDLSEEDKEEIGRMIQAVSKGMPDDIFAEESEKVMKDITATFANIDFSGPVSELFLKLQESLNERFREALTVASEVNFDLYANYQLPPPNAYKDRINTNTGTPTTNTGTPTINAGTPTTKNGGNTGSKPSPRYGPADDILTNAAGGFIQNMQLSWLGEEGPEAVIPLVPGRRGRALDLYGQVGSMLGVMDQSMGDFAPYDPGEPVPLAAAGESGSEMNVQVQMSPTFAIQSEGGKEKDIVKLIQSNMKELADEVGGELAVRLQKVFSNMPMKGA